MAQETPSSSPDDDDSPRGDPWHAFGYVVAGVVVYGAVGAALDWWLGTSYLVAVGILAGAGLGVYMTWVRFNKERPDGQHDEHEQS